MSELTPITREEALLAGQDLTPITRQEMFIKHIYDASQEIPEPITREEWFLKKAAEGGGGGGDITVVPLSVTDNGIYTAPSGKAYSPVSVDVPEPTLITKSITANGTYSASDDNADGYSSVIVTVDGFKKKSIANTPTDIASFNDGTANPMPSLEISIEPVQSGSGDPSPQNVRPISGWSGANVNVSGVNLWNEEWEGGSYSSTGQKVPTQAERIRSVNKIAVLPNTAYYASKGVYIICQYDKNGNFISFAQLGVDAASNIGHLFTTEANTYYITFATYAYYSTTYNHDISINYPATDTSYHAYNGSTLSIPFHDNSDNPITVYGGQLNVTAGELTVTHANIASYNGETINEPWISSMDVYSAGATPTTGAQVVYPLTTPQTYQLTPTQVSTLLGQNNIFANCGQVLEGEYFVTL